MFCRSLGGGKAHHMNKKEFKSDCFDIRAMGFGELAQMYLPDILPLSATIRLRAWIEMNEELTEKLKKLGFKKRTKVLTPKMVKVILEHLGTP